jgi:hypothetical protein
VGVKLARWAGVEGLGSERSSEALSRCFIEGLNFAEDCIVYETSKTHIYQLLQRREAVAANSFWL